MIRKNRIPNEINFQISSMGFGNNNLHNVDFIIEFRDEYKLPVSGIIDTRGQQNYISEEVVPKKHTEKALQESLVRDAFGNRINLTKK